MPPRKRATARKRVKRVTASDIVRVQNEIVARLQNGSCPPLDVRLAWAREYSARLLDERWGDWVLSLVNILVSSNGRDPSTRFNAANIVAAIGLPTRLDGAGRERLRKAIQSAFKADDLRMAAREHLEFELSDEVHTAAAFKAVVFDLIDHCQRHGRVRDLIDMVIRLRPHRTDLRTTLEHLRV
ncbi:MAG TPA: effector-associated domain EAD1-containing protein [Gemmataceae bacterium]|nr:effector-associated domain EAD1-containing protein [Gemmataceae bacterium]